MLVTDVPEDLLGHGIAPAQKAADFAVSLDVAEPWGGGRVEGRVEHRGERRDRHPITVVLRCDACWLDVAPELVGRRRPGIGTYWGLRTRAVPIWLDAGVWAGAREVGDLVETNWRHFDFVIPPGLPRAVEGTFVAFRWRVEARRRRRLVGWAEASVPLLLREQRTIPTVRVEESPIGTWRLLEWRSEGETDGAAEPCSVRYEERRPEDLPLPGETRETELARRLRS